MDVRNVQELAADERQEQVVREAQDTRARLDAALKRLELELRNVQEAVRELPSGPLPPAQHRAWWWRR